MKYENSGGDLVPPGDHKKIEHKSLKKEELHEILV
jgi:hypothetical protein